MNDAGFNRSMSMVDGLWPFPRGYHPPGAIESILGLRQTACQHPIWNASNKSGKRVSPSCDALDTQVGSISTSRNMMNLQDSIRMDTSMDVRKQFIICAIEIWLFITNRGSALKTPSLHR